MQGLEGEFVEAETQVFDDFLGLALAAGIDDEPAVFRVDPDEGAAFLGEGARHQFFRDALAQFLHLLATGRVALFAGDPFGAFLRGFVDDRGGQQALFGGQRQQPLAVFAIDQAGFLARWRPAA